jgi:glutathione S-transferase
MKLYVTLTSPYSRLVRAVIIEKKLQDRVAVTPIQTRTPDSPLYAINPSGRVPTLVTNDGVIFEDSSLICTYLDHLEGAPIFDIPYDENRWPTLRLEAKVRSMLDGISVWGREFLRPVDERSPTIIDHETARAHRMADSLDKDVADGLFDGPLSIAQLLLACALPPYWHAKLDVREDRLTKFQWRSERCNLSIWVDRFSERPSIQETIPPAH